MLLAVAVTGIFPRKPCYDATTFAEKTLGSGGRFWLVSHILSYQHTKTGKKKTKLFPSFIMLTLYL